MLREMYFNIDRNCYMLMISFNFLTIVNVILKLTSFIFTVSKYHVLSWLEKKVSFLFGVVEFGRSYYEANIYMQTNDINHCKWLIRSFREVSS